MIFKWKFKRCLGVFPLGKTRVICSSLKLCNIYNLYEIIIMKERSRMIMLMFYKKGKDNENNRNQKKIRSIQKKKDSGMAIF